jgi:hypothetical protein
MRPESSVPRRLRTDSQATSAVRALPRWSGPAQMFRREGFCGDCYSAAPIVKLQYLSERAGSCCWRISRLLRVRGVRWRGGGCGLSARMLASLRQLTRITEPHGDPARERRS